MKRFSKSFFAAFRFDWKNMVVLLARNSRQPIMKVFYNISLLLGGHKTDNMKRSLFSMLTYLHKLLKAQGPVGLVKYLKAVTVCLQQMVAGYHVKDFGSPRFSRTRSGLPRLFPTVWRRRIREGHTFYIRMALSISNLYRVVQYPGKLNLSTITQMPSYNLDFMKHMKGFIAVFLWMLGAEKFFQPSKLRSYLKWFPIYKSGPTVIKNDKSSWSSSRVSIVRAREAFLRSPKLLESIRSILSLFVDFSTKTWLTHEGAARLMPDGLIPGSRWSNTSRPGLYHGLTDPKDWSSKTVTQDIVGDISMLMRRLKPHFDERQYVLEEIVIDPPKPGDYPIVITGDDKVQAEIERFHQMVKDPNYPRFKGSYMVSQPLVSPCLGKLGLKEEPAGKVRVFAMVDPITQWVLRPIHKAIFSLLRTLPMDGTFNQLKPLSRLKVGTTGLYSLDLTAATDRLPVLLQEWILSPLLGPEKAAHWKNLLVGRGYHLKGDILNYETGQPMGALSSWAMLALTHHFIVQFSAWKSGVTPTGTLFRNYAILGDDCVIADGSVAREYLHVMKMLGVPINLSKSILSREGIGLEFAKKTIVRGVDCSPLPVREFSEATGSLTSLAALFQKYNPSTTNKLAVMGYGYKVASAFDHTPAIAMKGRYKWLKILLSFPQNRYELNRWLPETMSRHQLWALLILEFNLIFDKIEKLPKPLIFVRNKGFVPYSGWNAGPSESPRGIDTARFGDFFTLESRHTLNYYKLVYARLLKNRDLLKEQICLFFEDEMLDPWDAFSLMLKIYKDTSLFTLGVSPHKKRKDVLRNTKSHLWSRWIKKLSPIKSVTAPIHYELPPHFLTR